MIHSDLQTRRALIIDNDLAFPSVRAFRNKQPDMPLAIIEAVPAYSAFPEIQPYLDIDIPITGLKDQIVMRYLAFLSIAAGPYVFSPSRYCKILRSDYAGGQHNHDNSCDHSQTFHDHII